MAYDSLSVQIEALKSEMTSAISSTAMGSQDMIYMAKALGELGGLLGVNDIVQATADKITELETKKTTTLASLETNDAPRPYSAVLHPQQMYGSFGLSNELSTTAVSSSVGALKVIRLDLADLLPLTPSLSQTSK